MSNVAKHLVLRVLLQSTNLLTVMREDIFAQPAEKDSKDRTICEWIFCSYVSDSNLLKILLIFDVTTGESY